MSAAFQKLWSEVADLFDREPALREFCSLPSDLSEQPVEPAVTPAVDLFLADEGLFTNEYKDLSDAVIAASPEALWRETYKGTRIGEIFRNRFGCYCLVGGGGPFASNEMGAYFVYMPKGLYYPFHHHPAEELYFIIAGEAEFMLEGEETKTLGPGQSVFHPSNNPHATQTHEHPFLALVLWRGDMSVRPVLSYPEGDA